MCDRLSLEALGEDVEEKEKELSPHVPPGSTGVPTQDRGHGLQLSDAQKYEVCFFPQP